MQVYTVKAVWNGLASALLAGVIAVVPVSAQAADIYDAWINILADKAFIIGTVETRAEYAQGVLIDVQVIEGTHAGEDFYFNLQRSSGASGMGTGFNGAVIDSPAASAASFARRLKLPPEETTNFRKLAGRQGRGATIDHRGCRMGCSA